ncbi:zinc-ribbon domain-containing protein [Limosilactobacillus reuteri]|uniref:zinc-ribbon domain-containing protein n=1 Tax=Limosilactobacillus reuteri TaxID=1598 RepID=UPI0039838E8A|nr:zinc ribbon domain-containing protein [Limosilactobacillus reuteri]MCC4350607.1 zinc ribbon domain-containing protein [Limosilactobacillus reuteri]MCC4360395.1 zinc ribbon domain-containing protein [Limosilactobacillus reuteri]MCC4379005.1 zinc ribbon domain-containing protein [Limosilactobacillus reuteri]MCC4407737.1 zinc ribbon domain-containing protein [Limosilactobacillus reuteri]
MKKCPYCNTLNPDDAEVCENCGKPLKGQMLALVCPNCGKVNALGSREWALCPVKYTDQIDKNFRRLDCGIVPRSSRFCLCKRVWY